MLGAARVFGSEGVTWSMKYGVTVFVGEDRDTLLERKPPAVHDLAVVVAGEPR